MSCLKFSAATPVSRVDIRTTRIQRVANPRLATIGGRFPSPPIDVIPLWRMAKEYFTTLNTFSWPGKRFVNQVSKSKVTSGVVSTLIQP